MVFSFHCLGRQRRHPLPFAQQRHAVVTSSAIEASVARGRYACGMTNRNHHYDTRLVWEGNRGDGTAQYESYGRDYRVSFEGKPGMDLEGSADAAFRGDAAKLNPEDLLVASLSACHMLTYLALCARGRIRVVAYEDHASGVLAEDGRGGGRFESVELRPRVVVADPRQAARAAELHDLAHELCFIANSCNFPVRHRAEVTA